MLSLKIIRYIFAATTLLLCMAFLSRVDYGVDPPVIKTLDGSAGQLKVDSLILVEDAKFFSGNTSLIRPYRVQNMVSLEVNEFAMIPVQDTFSVTARLLIKKTDAQQQVSQQTLDLTVKYNIDSTYEQRSSHLFTNAYRVEVKVISLSKSVPWDAYALCKVVNHLQAFPEYQFDCTSNAVQSIVANTANVVDELPVSWPHMEGADEYDLEWAYIDTAALNSNIYGNPASPNPLLLFANNSGRVTVTGTSYRIPLFYDRVGKLFFRVRSVRWASTLGADGGRMEANWSSAFPGGLGVYSFAGHEQNINWQSSTSFAEEGKRKTVMQYFDGSLRLRQTATKDNVTDRTIVAESMYDFQGRPVVQVLPAPSLGNAIKYARNFNRAVGYPEYEKNLYDTLPDPAQYCEQVGVPMANDTGASKYYSSNNPFLNAGDTRYGFVPDAELYPFTEVEYTQDNTGRVTRQSGVGKTFRLGSGRETVYSYGTPDQRELDALFGTEVGLAAHYQKTVVRDANGQSSISYTDMRGRTIATALAGSVAGAMMDTLASAKKETRTETLADPSTTVIRDLVMESKRGLEVTDEDSVLHNFEYKLTPESIQLEDCGNTEFCYDCLYDLEITVTSNCNNCLLPGKQPYYQVVRNFSFADIDTTCNPAQAFHLNFSLWLKKGSYEITKRLSVNRAAMNYYRDSLFMVRNHCNSMESFASEYRQLHPVTGGCQPACEGCLEEVGTWETYWTNYKNLYNISGADTAVHKDKAMRAHMDAVEACNALCSNVSEKDDTRNAMLMDLSPPMGQYADPGRNNNPRNIFYIADLSTPIYQRVSGYKDAAGNPALVFRESTGTMVPPQQLSVNEFIAAFQPSWAEALLHFHPEYRLWEKFALLETSLQWDRKVEKVNTYQEAKQKGYMNPTGAVTIPFSYFAGTGTIENDPLSTLLGGVFKTDIESAIVNYSGTTSMYGVASMAVLCNNTNPSNCQTVYASGQQLATNSAICDADRNMAWLTFRSMYQTWKKTKIESWMNAQFPGNTTADSLFNEGFIPQFATSSLFDRYGLPVDTSQATKDGLAVQAAAYYQSNCQSYVQYWLKTLSASCILYDTNDLKEKVLPLLLDVCLQGADIDHPYGSSTVAPSSTYKFKSFEEVILYYNRLKGINNDNCNPYVITVPRPYDQQVINSTKPLLQKPADCECTLINDYYRKYQAKSNLYNSFGHFMREAQKTAITDSTADLLLSLCNSSGTCTYFTEAIALPPAFQCNSGDVCIDCELFNKYDSSFRIAYPDVLPSADLSLREDSVQQSWNRLYENYMNFKAGFAKSAIEYLEFAQQCNGISRSPGCDSLSGILLRFRIQKKATNAIKYQRGYWVEPGVKIELTNAGDIVKNGVLMLPDSVRANAGTGYTSDRISAVGFRDICFPQGFSYEFRFKMIGAATDGILFFSNAGFFGGTFTLTAQGLKLTQVTSPDSGVVHNTDIIVHADRNIIYDWCTVTYKTTTSQIYVYFNGVEVFTASRNPAVPLPSFQQMGSDFRSRLGAIDWYKLFDHNGELKYFEDFNNLNGYTFPEESIYCTGTVSDWKADFVNYFNEQNGNSGLTYKEIEALYLQKCGKLPDLRFQRETLSNAELHIVKSFNDTVVLSRGVPAMLAASLPPPDSIVTDKSRITRNGVMMWEDRLQKKNAINEYSSHRIATPAGVLLCTDKGYSLELRFKMSADILPATSDLFEISDGNGGFAITRNSTGTYISHAWMVNGSTVTSTYPNIQLSNKTDLIREWNNYKVVFSGDSMKIYLNGVRKGVVKVAGKTLININEIRLKVLGYKGMVDWVKMQDGKGYAVYHEDFNDPLNAANFIPSFICSALPDCQTTFMNYYNQQRGTSFTFKQIDSTYFSRTGKSLDVCGTKDSLVALAKRYFRDAHPNRLDAEHYINDLGLSGNPYFRIRNKEISFEDGMFRWPDTIRNAGTFDNWWRYSYLQPYGLKFCQGNGYTLEARVRLLKDNHQTDVENFLVGINDQFTLVFTKISQSTHPRRGFTVNRLEVKRHADTPANYNILPVRNVVVSTDPSFLSRDWHELKIQVTSTEIIVYWNKKEMCRGPKPFNIYTRDFNAVMIGFMGSHGAIDWFKVYNERGEIMVNENFNDPVQRAVINPEILCPKFPYDCQTSYATYFNQRRGTNYTFAKIDSIYRVTTGKPLEVCNIAPTTPPVYTLCGRAATAFPVVTADPIDGCSDSTVFMQEHVQTRYNLYLDSLRGAFDSVYTAKCLNAYKFESFVVRRTVQEYHYTLYYYDQAGNLVKTIPPSGVKPNRDSLWLDDVYLARKNKQVLVPDHELATDYRYNGLNQVVSQKSPDGGKSRFWYDRLGRLVISQNAKQQYASTTEENRLYSYTKYDVLGRITEVGQLKNLAVNGGMLDTTSRTPALLDAWMTALNQRREQITSTVYDLAYPGFTGMIDASQILRQRNLRNRVSYTTYSDSWNTSNYNQGTFYTYDIHGNVDTLLQDFGCGTCGITGVHNIMNRNGNRFKKISYNYDLISGKVNSVAYQKGWSDQFFHKYSYDGENRLTLVETSMDGFNWEREARYEYYLHGPLARTVLGSQQVQGIDYAYTLQGWLKGVNSSGATSAFDIGSDGRLPVGSTSYANQFVARDAFGFALNYFSDDYKPVSSLVNPFPGYSAYLNADFRPLYNGNISSMVSTNRMFENPAVHKDSAALLFNYRYDQLNRITGMDVYNKFSRSSNSFSGLTRLEQFKERVLYDPNGNILKYLRNGDGNGNANQLRMDSLQYHYYAGTNRLRNVRDSVPGNWYGTNASDKIVDIDDQDDADNYIYDSIGNLIQDKAEKITAINWNVYGKIIGISRGAGTHVPASEIRYTYDAAGNRISKSVEKNGQKTITWYVRDAQGNVMATYSGDAPAATALEGFALQERERYIYGSNRLGVVTVAQGVDNGNAGPASVVDTGGVFLRGARMYELSNHLGNVLVTVSDKKKGIADPILSSLISHFEPIMLSGTDYYPFGMAMRVGGDNKYKYGFNGKENDNEVKGGDGLQLDYGFRVYDPRVGKFLSVDPLAASYPWNSTYAFAENDVIRSIDLDGLEKKVVIHWVEKVYDDGALKIVKTAVNIDQDAKFDGWGQPSSKDKSSGSVYALTETYYYMMSDQKLYKGKDLLENANVNNVNPPPSAQYDYTPNVMRAKNADDKSWAGWNPLKKLRILIRDLDAPDNAMTVDDVSMGMLAFTSVLGAPATVRSMLKAEGVAVEGVNAAAAANKVDNAASVVEEGYTRVGRWMSETEYKAMKATNKMQEGAGGQTFASTKGSDSFRSQAKKGTVYVEFDVPTNSLLEGGKLDDWVKTIGEGANNSMKNQLKKKGGKLNPEVKNISEIIEKKN